MILAYNLSLWGKSWQQELEATGHITFIVQGKECWIHACTLVPGSLSPQSHSSKTPAQKTVGTTVVRASSEHSQGNPPQICLLVKIQCSQAPELKLTWRLPPCRLAYIVKEGIVQASNGKKQQQSCPAVVPMNSNSRKHGTKPSGSISGTHTLAVTIAF